MKLTSSKPSDRVLATYTARVCVFLAFLMTAFGACGTIQLRRETAEPRDVSTADLSDQHKVPSGTKVRVHTQVRGATAASTTRGNTLVALAGSPDVVVLCDEDQAECSGVGPATRDLVGRVLDHDDVAVPTILDEYAKATLHLDVARVRVLNVRGGAAGFRGNYLPQFVLAGIVAVALLAFLARWIYLLRRAQRT